MNDVAPIRDDDPRLSAFRSPPHSVEAEKAFLGSVLVRNEVMDGAGLAPEHFALAQNGRIFAACLALREAGRPIDPVTMKAFVEGDEGLGKIGAAAYIAELAVSGVGPINAREYARLIRDLARRRAMIGIGGGLVDAAFAGDVERDACDIWREAEAEAEAAGLIDVEAFEEDAGTLEHLEAIFNNPGALLGVSSGFRVLDESLCGLQPGQLILIAGRPSMGKTTLAVAMARKSGARALFLSLEQDRREIELKLISDIADVPLETMRRGRYADGQWQRVSDAYNDLRGLPLTVSGRSGMSPAEIRAAARAQVKSGLDVLFVDQLTHIAPPNPRTVNKVHQIGEILKALKALARELRIPIVLCHQLNRALEAREDKRPGLSDLRDSGEIEQDADVVLFVHRAEYYLSRGEPEQPDPSDFEGGAESAEFGKAASKRMRWERRVEAARNVAEIIVAKQRMGPIGTVNLYFDGRYSRLADIGRNE